MRVNVDVRFEVQHCRLYGYPLDNSTVQRNRRINRAKEASNVDGVNIVMGDFNFVEESTDRNNQMLDCLVTCKDSLVINEWKIVKNAFHLNDTSKYKSSNLKIQLSK